jgi:hypothetical protein
MALMGGGRASNRQNLVGGLYVLGGTSLKDLWDLDLFLFVSFCFLA